MMLSEHFSLDELCASETAVRKGIDNTPPPELIPVLTRTAMGMEKVRKFLGHAIHINSGYRCMALNQLVKGQPNSQHLVGCAADMKIDGMTPDEVVKAIKNGSIAFDQMIREFDSWTHISVQNTTRDAPRHQALIIDKQGTRLYG